MPRQRRSRPPASTRTRCWPRRAATWPRPPRSPSPGRSCAASWRASTAARSSLEPGGNRRIRAAGPDRYGRGGSAPPSRSCDPRCWVLLAMHGRRGWARPTSTGLWDTDDLTAVLRLLARSYRRFAADPADAHNGPRRRCSTPIRRRHRPGQAPRSHQHPGPLRPGQRLLRALPRPHDDVLSSGCSPTPDAPLAEASQAKLDRLCRLLDLRPATRSSRSARAGAAFAVHAARHYGAGVTTTTFSAEQHAYATERVAAAGLSDRVTVLHDDYRDLDGTFDKLRRHRDDRGRRLARARRLLRRTRRLLLPSGAVGLQAIVTAPVATTLAQTPTTSSSPSCSRAAACRRWTPSWTRQPGSPTWFRVDLSDYGLHYAETLRRWRVNLD